MRKSFIFGYTNAFMLKPAFQGWKYSLRLKSVSITMIESFILACQRIFLKALVSMHPQKNNSLAVKKILKKGGANNHDYNNLNTNLSHTQSFRLYRIIINKYLGLCFYRSKST